MGEVYEAYDPFVRRSVAIKVAHPFESKSDKNAERRREAFFAEVYSAGRMHHPAVVGVYDAGQEDNFNYIVMEFIDGQSLQEYVSGKKELTPSQIVDVIYQCAKGLDYVHRQGIIHRDLKPSNIMLSKDGEVKIMDFSIAHVGAGSQTSNSKVLGSPMYMPPEQLTEEKRLVPQSDVYSLGAVMYALLARRPIFRAGSLSSLIYRITNLEPESLNSLRPDVPQHIIDIVEMAMQKIIYNRYETAQIFAHALSSSFGRLRVVGERIDMQEKWNTLRQLRFFKDFSDERISEVVDASELTDYKKDEIIVTEGEMETSFYIIAKGQVDVTKDDKVVGKMTKGDCFGEIAFITKKPRSVSIVARSEVSLMAVSNSLLESASLETQLQYYRVFLENLILRLAHATNRLTKTRQGIEQ